MKKLLMVALATFGAALGGCGHFGMGGSAAERALIVFRNQSIDQADVYAVAPSSDWTRIGTVMPGRADTLVVPAGLTATGSVNIVARLLSKSNTPSSGPLPLRGGDIFEVTLQPDERSLVALPSRP